VEGDVLATVNGQPVLLEDVEQRLRSLHESASADSRAEFDVDRLMFQVVNDVLLGQEARVLGMQEEEKIRSRVEAFRQKRIVRLFEQSEIGDKAAPTDEEVRAFFQSEYRTATLRTVSAYEKVEADEILQLLRDGADMAQMARERSVDPYALRGGLAEEVARIDLQREIAAAAFALEPGELGGPVRTKLGWSVIRVEAFADPSPALYDEVKSLCRRLVGMAKANRVRAELTAQARKQIAVSVDQQVANSIRPERLPDGRLMPKVEDEEAIIARIGDKVTVTARDYAKDLVARWKGVRNVEAAEAAAPLILRNLIDRKVMLAEALRRGYGERDDIQRSVHAFETQLLVPRYLEEMVGANIQVSQDEMKAYYEEHKNEFHRPPRVRLGQITVETEEEAQRIAAELRKGTDFAWLAKQRSIDRLKESGGDRGWYVPQPDVDDFNRDLFTAQAGQILDPFGVPGNVIVLKIMARQEQGIYEYEEISGNLRAAVFQEKLATGIEAFMEKLRSRAEIKINEEKLAELNITGAPENGSEQGGTGGEHGH
jgi:parvulin-like peptidyl-prolyl isomerase